MSDKIFISYHFGRQQKDKDRLVQEIKERGSYLQIRNYSVDKGDIPNSLSDLEIFRIIREKFKR